MPQNRFMSHSAFSLREAWACGKPRTERGHTFGLGLRRLGGEEPLFLGSCILAVKTVSSAGDGFFLDFAGDGVLDFAGDGVLRTASTVGDADPPLHSPRGLA